MDNLKIAEPLNPLAFILNNNILSENGSPIEFKDHYFLIDPYADMSPEQVVMKPSQIGWSVLGINKSLWLAKYKKANIVYTLPSKSIVKDFVSPKVDPIIIQNPIYQSWLGKTDSIALKAVGDRFIYFRGCFDEETEILTKEGWKHHKDLRKEEAILNVDITTEDIVIDKIDKILEYEVDEELNLFNGNVNLKVTDDHKMVIRKHEKGKLSFIRAKELIENDKRCIPLRFNPLHSRGIKKSNVFMELLGWVIGDGSYWIECKKNKFIKKDGTISPDNLYYQRVVIIQKKNISQLKNLLTRGKFSYYEKNKGNEVLGFELGRRISHELRRICPKKELTTELVMNLTYNQRKALFAGLMASDGHVNGRMWYQADKSESEAFQLLVFLMGRNASVYKRENKGGFKEGSVDYPVYIKSSKNCFKFKKSKDKYKGNVWCVSTTNGTIITRRHGVISVSGNSWEELAAISISAHVLINDERDRSNQKVLSTYTTRLDDAKRERPDLGFIWQWSNPSIPGYGVDETWQRSDQKHWFIKCPHCNSEFYLKYPDNINFQTEQYICSSCQGVLSNDDRRLGRWVKKFTNRDISGYWISQLMVPWISAKDIIKKSKGDKSIFHNFCLGLPFISADESVSRKTITDCIVPTVNPRTHVVIGVDNGVVKTVVVGNVHGIFKIYETESWEDIEADLIRYNATMVIDANPYPTRPKQLTAKYPGRVFSHYFIQEQKDLQIIKWGEGDKDGVVVSDRTKIIDMVVSELKNQDIIFNLTLTELEQYINDWTQLYRTIEENAQGIQKPVWRTIEDRRDHYAFAQIYWRIALEKVFVFGGVIKTPSKKKHSIIKEGVYVSPDKTIPAIDLKEVTARSLKGKKDWRSR